MEGLLRRAPFRAVTMPKVIDLRWERNLREAERHIAALRRLMPDLPDGIVKVTLRFALDIWPDAREEFREKGPLPHRRPKS